MKIKLLSDLHLEFGKFDLQHDGADVLVIAGDLLIVEYLYDISEFDMNNRFTQNLLSNKFLKVQDFRNFLKQASEMFKHVVYVMGNHEFYGGRFFGSILHLQEELEPFENIYLLENNAKELDGVLFLGATFWTDFNKHDPISMYDAGLFMNDYKSIRWDKDGLYRKLAPKDSFGRHVRSAHYFRGVLKDTVQPVVVVTHHAPSYASIHDRYKQDIGLNGAYASDMSELIFEFPNIVYWLHGHVHNTNDYTIGNTRVVSNPRGYHGYEENPDFNPNLILEI